MEGGWMCDSSWSSRELQGQRLDNWEGICLFNPKIWGDTFCGTTSSWIVTLPQCHLPDPIAWSFSVIHTVFLSDNLTVPTFTLHIVVWSQLALLCYSCCEPWHAASILCLCSCSAAASTAANNLITFFQRWFWGGGFCLVALPLLKHFFLTQINYCLVQSPLSLLLLTSSLLSILSLTGRKKCGSWGSDHQSGKIDKVLLSN